MSGSGMVAMADVEQYISLCASFRARAGDASAAAAKSRIYYGESELPPDTAAGALLAPLRPYVVLVPDTLGYDPNGIGDSIEYLAQGGIMAIFQDNPRYIESFKESLRDYWDWITSITDEISAMHRTDPYIRFRMRMVYSPYRPPLQQRGSDDFWECGILFTYGDP